ncbi:MAG: isoamylase, partial [Frankiales bacterium]|nr:isoamylase [Frankiales bacterium]
LGMYLDGRGIKTRGPRGEEVVDDSFLLVLHMGADDVDVTLPPSPWAEGYDVVVDTAGELWGTHSPGKHLRMTGRSVLVLRAAR